MREITELVRKEAQMKLKCLVDGSNPNPGPNPSPSHNPSHTLNPALTLSLSLPRYHVALAQKQIRLDLNERVKATVQTHARLQKASLTPCDGGEGMTLLVTQQPEGTATYLKQLGKKEVRRFRKVGQVVSRGA